MSTFATPIPSGKTAPSGFLRILGKLFTGSGVVEPDALKVSAQVSPDMTVRVSGSALNDNAVFIHTDGTFIQAWNDQNVTLPIAANASGVTKTDAVVAYVDLASGEGENSTPNNLGALKFKTIRRSGTLTGNPISSEITSDPDVGSNPSFVRALVTVANGATSVNSGNITNQSVETTFTTSMMAAMYPIGSTYTNASDTTNPSELLGFGTWEAFGAGRVLVGVDAGQPEFNTLGETGGAKTHTLTEAEMPNHDHASDTSTNNFIRFVGSGGNLGAGAGSNISGSPLSLSNKGGGDAHDNLQPYITVYMWRRTA